MSWRYYLFKLETGPQWWELERSSFCLNVDDISKKYIWRKGRDSMCVIYCKCVVLQVVVNLKGFIGKAGSPPVVNVKHLNLVQTLKEPFS